MRKIFIIVFLWLLCLGAAAQSISVKSFKALPMDLTAMSLEGKRIDQNGDVAALIKVVTTETGFVFEGGTLGIVDTKQTPGEVWVWVPRAARKITIKHPKLGVLRDYYYPIEIEPERTYELVLTTAKIETIVKEEVRMQYLAFQISPPNATLVVDEKYWDVEADGSAQDYVNFGTYSWRVEAPNYHSDAGRVTVDDPNNAKIVPVTLQPNFGWIEVAETGSLQGASVYVDNVLIGRAPCKSEALKSGKHTVRITKKMYDAYTETVTVADNEITRLAPSLTADFAEVTLTVDADADIYVNDERKGTRTWTGPLGSGTYKIECKQANHETGTTTKEITAAMEGQTITLPAPRPIYGALNVESTPNFCKLYIDGKDMGTTPKSIAEILIGQHEIRLTKDGYADYVETVTITKGDRRQVKAILSSNQETQFAFSPKIQDFTFFFPKDSWDINKRTINKSVRAAMIEYLKEYPEIKGFRVEGWCSGDETDTDMISENRAKAVVDAIKSIVKAAGKNVNDFEFHPYGEGVDWNGLASLISIDESLDWEDKDVFIHELNNSSNRKSTLNSMIQKYPILEERILLLRHVDVYLIK